MPVIVAYAHPGLVIIIFFQQVLHIRVHVIFIGLGFAT